MCSLTDSSCLPTVWLAVSLARRMISAKAWRSSSGGDAGPDFFGAFCDDCLRKEEVVSQLGQFVQRFRGHSHAFVFEKAADQFGSRVFRFLVRFGFHFRQQKTGFDFHQHGGHQEIFRGQFQLLHADTVDVMQVLQCQLGHGNVQNIEILAPDKVKQQVERTFECFQKDFQRFRRNVEITGDFRDGFTVQACDDVAARPLCRMAQGRSRRRKTYGSLWNPA